MVRQLLWKQYNRVKGREGLGVGGGSAQRVGSGKAVGEQGVRVQT